MYAIYTYVAYTNSMYEKCVCGGAVFVHAPIDTDTVVLVQPRALGRRRAGRPQALATKTGAGRGGTPTFHAGARAAAASAVLARVFAGDSGG